MKRTFILLLLLFCSYNFFGQEPYKIHYSINEGLPTNTVYSAYQDKLGFIWFATDVGIIKYNSNKFELFSTDYGLSDNEVFKIEEDYKGRKWLLTLNGTPSYILNDTIYNSHNSSLVKKIRNNRILVDFHEDEQSNIYLVSRNGFITKIDSNDNVSELKKTSTNTSGIWSINNQLFILNSLGIYSTLNDSIIETEEGDIPYRVFHSKGKTYFNNLNILFKIKKGISYEKIITLPEKVEIIDVFVEEASKMWICTRNGLFLYQNNTFKKRFFKNEAITSLSKDFEGNFWATTLNNGVFLIPSFNVISKNISINTISKKEANEVWFGGMQNDYYIKKSKGFDKQEFNSKWRKDQISKIRFFNENTYIIGKVGTRRISRSKLDLAVNLNDILEENDSLYLGTAYASIVSKNDFEKKKYKKIYKNKFLNKRINTIEKIDATIYFGTNLGLYSYKSNNIEFLGDKFVELKSPINQLFFDKETKRLLIATASKGVVVLQENNSDILSISKKDGLNNNSINSIEKINENLYLVASNKGLNLIDFSKPNFTIKSYNTYFAFKNKKINDIAKVNDTIYLATDKELIYFNEAYISQKITKPKTFIKRILANNKKINIHQKSNIDYNLNNITIDFDGISFLDEGQLKFYYKLNNSDWIYTSNRSVNYKNLSANNYTFSVYAVNGLENKSEIKTIQFTINAPFWQTWWFIILILLLLFSVISVIIQFRISLYNKKFLKEKKAILLEKENIALENQMLALEQKALRLQMNPHFIFNALNTIKGYYSEGNIKEASSYISKFSKLLRLLLENVEQYISLELEVEMLQLFLELTKIRYQNKFDYYIKVDEKLNHKEINIPTLLLQPIIENSIIHGIAPKKSRGKIIISFKSEEKNLVCVVTDNGIGIENSQKNKKTKHSSKALKITKERLQLIENQEGVRCSIKFKDLGDNKKRTGTTVVIKIPLLKIW